MGRSRTGDGDEYDHADEDAAQAAADEAWAQWEDEAGGYDDGGNGAGGGAGSGAGGGSGDVGAGGAGLPTAMYVTGEVEWSGENRGTRSTTLEGLDLAEFRRASQRAAAATAKASAARPAANYRAKGWNAQLKQLESTARGRDALSRAGFDPSARSRRRWRSGSGLPSKQRREQIGEAYQDARMWRVRAADQARRAANKDLTDTLTDTLRDRYQTTIRVHGIQSIELRRR